MTVHDALEAWQAGEITSRRAMTLTDTTDLLELYALAAACDVEIRSELTENERRAVSRVEAAIHRAFARDSDEPEDGLKSA